jgi:hypothetical protein
VAAPAAALAVWGARRAALWRSWPARLALAGLGGLTVWSAASIGWALSPELARDDAERTLLALLVLVAAAAICARVPRAPERLALGISLAAAPAIAYALISKAVPRLAASADVRAPRLEAPVGYWNGLALLAALALPGALWAGARAGRAGRAAAAAWGALLVTALLLTLSRSGVLSAIAALVLLIAMGPRRGRLAGLAASAIAGAALPAAYGLSADRLTADGLTAGQRSGAGAVLGLLLVLGAALAAALVAVADRPRVRAALGARTARRLALGALIAVLVGAAVAVGAAHQDVGGWLRDRGDELEADQAGVPNSAGRFGSLGSNHRVEYWREALDAFEGAPLIGEGAGSFALIQLRSRPDPADPLVRQPHQLALQALAELGVIGLALLALFVAAVVWAAVRARRLGAPGAGACAAIVLAVLVQAQLDWSWSIPAVAAAATGAAGALLAAAAPGEVPAPAGGPWAARAGAAALAVLAVGIAAAALLPWLARRDLASARADLRAGRPAAAVASADDAHALDPLALTPLLVRAEAEGLMGQLAARVATARRAVDLEPDGPDAWRALGRAERGAAARAAWTRVLALSRGDHEATVALTGDLVRNGSFESRAIAWTGFQASVRRVRVPDAPLGEWAMLVTRREGAVYTLDDLPSTVRSVPRDGTYRAGAWVRAASPEAVGRPLCLTIRLRTRAFADIAERAGCAPLGRRFRRVSVSAPARAGEMLDVYLAQRDAAAGDAFLADGVALRRVGGRPR